MSFSLVMYGNLIRYNQIIHITTTKQENVDNDFLPFSSAHIYTLVDHKIAMQRSLPLPQCLFTFLQLLTIIFSIDNNQNSNNINNRIIQFTQPEYDGIIFETNSTTKFTISTNSNEVVNMYKTCFWLNVMHYTNVDQVVNMEIQCQEFNPESYTVEFNVVFNASMYNASIVSAVANIISKTKVENQHERYDIIRTIFVGMETFGDNNNDFNDHYGDFQGLVPRATATYFNMKLMFMKSNSNRNNIAIINEDRYFIQFINPINYLTITDHYFKITVKLLKNAVSIKHGYIKLRIRKQNMGTIHIKTTGDDNHGDVFFETNVNNVAVDNDGIISLQYWQTTSQIKAKENLLIFTVEYYNELSKSNPLVYDQVTVSNIMWNKPMEETCNMQELKSIKSPITKAAIAEVSTSDKKPTIANNNKTSKIRVAIVTFLLSNNHYIHGLIALAQSTFIQNPNIPFIVLAPANSLSNKTVDILQYLNVDVRFVEEIKYGREFFRYPTNIWTRLQIWSLEEEFEYILMLDVDSLLLKDSSILFNNMHELQEEENPPLVMNFMCPMKMIKPDASCNIPDGGSNVVCDDVDAMSMSCCTSSFIGVVKPSKKLLNQMKTWASLHSLYTFAEQQFINAFFYRKHKHWYLGKYYCNREHLSVNIVNMHKLSNECIIYDFTVGTSKNTKKIWLHSVMEVHEYSTNIYGNMESPSLSATVIENIHDIHLLWFDYYLSALKRLSSMKIIIANADGGKKDKMRAIHFMTDLPECNLVPMCRSF